MEGPSYEYFTSAGFRGLGSMQGSQYASKPPLLEFVNRVSFFVPIRPDFSGALIDSPTKDWTQLNQRSRPPHMQRFCLGRWLK